MFVVIVLSPSRQTLGQYTKTGHNHCLSHPSEFIINDYPPIQCYIPNVAEKVFVK